MDFEMSESLLLELPVGLMYSIYQMITFTLITTRAWHINQYILSPL